MYDQLFETEFTAEERIAVEDAPYVWTVDAHDDMLATLFGMLPQDFYGFFSTEDNEGFIFGYEDMTLGLYEIMELLGATYYLEDRSLEEAA